MAQQLAGFEAKMDGIGEDGDSENETMRKKSARKGKGTLTTGLMSLNDLEEELGVGFVEPVVPRSFEAVRENVFGKAQTACKLGDSQPKRKKEVTQGTINWADGTEIPESDEEIEEPKEDIKVRLGDWARVNTLVVKFAPANGNPALEVRGEAQMEVDSVLGLK
ncbi:hypothetical protein BGX38DRAFT_1145321 [Terfezia claveryi]|nr:hypothetical protein BGX38DRAFT_1145321 [Terfezia claveryi]